MATWVTCTQPLFFPPLYMLERFARCDVVVLMQEAQHNRQAEHSWCMLSTTAGLRKESLTCRDKNRRPIDEIEVLDLKRWTDKFSKSCELAYGKQAGYREVLDSFETLLDELYYAPEGITLAEVSAKTMGWLQEQALIDTKVLWSKDLIQVRPDHAPEWLAGLTLEVEGTDYIQGETSIRSYFTPGTFKQYGLRVWGQAWKAPEIPRLCPDFSIRLSALDTLFCAGRAWVQDAIGAAAGRGEAFGTAVSMEDYA